MSALALKNKYQEDIAVVPGGTNIIGLPAVVYSITVALEADGDAVVSIGDGLTYSSSSIRVEKVVLTAENHTVQLVYPKGKPFSTGVSAISNVGSVDISITYE